MKRIAPSVLIMAAILAFAAPAWACLSLEGGTISIGSGITATGNWAGSNPSLSWSIKESGWGNHQGYSYEYKWTSGTNKDLAGLILETSADSSSDISKSKPSSFKGPAQYTINSETISGLEFYKNFSYSSGSNKVVTISFWSELAPDWGDFYVKGTKGQRAYNSGLGKTPDGNGGFVPVPGGGAPAPVPIPGAYILLGSGVICLVAFRKRIYK